MNIEIYCNMPVSLSIQQKPPKAAIIIHICIIADEADFTDGIIQPVLTDVIFLLFFLATFGAFILRIRAVIIFPAVTDRNINNPALEFGYSIPAAVPEIKAGPLEKQKQYIRFACSPFISQFLKLSATSLVPAG